MVIVVSWIVRLFLCVFGIIFFSFQNPTFFYIQNTNILSTLLGNFFNKKLNKLMINAHITRSAFLLDNFGNYLMLV